MADDTLTARNRINQRNFRARRQNYIKDLEERLRKYESEGVQATIEIQTAARQVTEQNVKLRALLMSRFGLNDHEIETYLNTHGPPVSIHSSLLPVALAANPVPKSTSDLNGFNLLSATSNVTSGSQQSPPTSILSPALGLAALHTASGQLNAGEPPTKKQRREFPTQMSISSLTSSEEGRKLVPSPMNGHFNGCCSSPLNQQDRLNNEQDPDTLSESSNPRTPADSLDPLLRPSLQTHHSNGYADRKAEAFAEAEFRQSEHDLPSATVSALAANLNIPKNHDGAVTMPATRKFAALGDETACEDAARIIASMRGINDRPEQILLEMGCAPSSKDSEPCKVKNLSIFSLMDRN